MTRAMDAAGAPAGSDAASLPHGVRRAAFLLVLATGCNPATLGERPVLVPPTITDPYAPEAVLRKLEKGPDEVVRVLVTVRVDQLSVDAAKKSVGEALRQAGADRVEPIDAQPILIVEARVDQLRTAVATGHVARLQIDGPVKRSAN